ncbi:MAG: 50S ribosomal protein L21 [Acidobacteria bacterium]|nr:50S ribosomal protein L21 [Acidobacteriota bacterium]
MYAIVQNGGHQVKVEPGTIVTVDRMDNESGAEVTFDEVLFVSKDGDIKAGTPFVAGAKVVGIVEDHPRGPKIRVFKSKRRKQERRTHGFRADQTRVRITSIQV